MHIQIIPQHKINTQLWDKCIEQSPYGRIYATTNYLNAMCRNWLGLVANNYSYVMPLPFTKKYGISYAYTPPLAQQLGIYGNEIINENLVKEFVTKIPSTIKYCELSFNAQNNLTKGVKRKNYLLPLANDYSVLQKKYSRQAKRNIVKATQENLVIKENILPKNIIDIHCQRFNNEIGVSQQDYFSLEKICNEYFKTNNCFTLGAFKNDELVAGSIYFTYSNRLTYILSGNSAQSLHYGASHFLKDYIIRKFAASSYTIDFEGSDNEAFARFYQQFGATEIEYYTHIIINKLPFPLHLLKTASNM